MTPPSRRWNDDDRPRSDDPCSWVVFIPWVIAFTIVPITLILAWPRY